MADILWDLKKTLYSFCFLCISSFSKCVVKELSARLALGADTKQAKNPAMRRAPLPAASLPAVFQDTLSRGKDAPWAAPSGTNAARHDPGSAQPARGRRLSRPRAAQARSPARAGPSGGFPSLGVSLAFLGPTSGRAEPEQTRPGGPGPRLSTARPGARGSQAPLLTPDSSLGTPRHQHRRVKASAARVKAGTAGSSDSAELR